MPNHDEKTVQALHDLIATCNDAAEGYGKAAKGVHDKELSERLARISGEREQFAAELSGAVSNAGGEARNDLHEGGILHRGWVDLETRIRPKNQHDILQDCLRGDEGTLKHYQHLLDQQPALETRALVERQRTAIQGDLEFLRSSLAKHKSQHA